MQVAYFQMAGAGKTRTQDALFDGVAVHQTKLHKARLVEAPQLPLRLAVADGLFASPAAGRASRFWMEGSFCSGERRRSLLPAPYPSAVLRSTGGKRFRRCDHLRVAHTCQRHGDGVQRRRQPDLPHQCGGMLAADQPRPHHTSGNDRARRSAGGG